MKILVCYTRFPWPTLKGDQLTVYKLLEYLSKNHEVDLLCELPDKNEYLSKLPKGLNHIKCIHNKGVGKVLRLAGALIGGKCLQISAFFSNQFYLERQRMLSENRYHIVYTHYIRSHGHINFESYGARKVIGLQLSHQAHYEKAYKRCSNLVLKYLYRIESERLKIWEGQIAGWNDLVHLISFKDYERISGSKEWVQKLFLNPHGVDSVKFCPDPSKRVRGRVVFTGNLGFQANEDAIVWFLDNVWPKVIKTGKSVHLLVAGSRPSAKLVGLLNRSQGCHIIPNPESMEEVIQTAEIAIDPLRIGAGLQNKILEAMSCGLPVVASSLANEGINAIDNQSILIADKAEEVCEKICILLDSQPLREQIGLLARQLILDKWSWDYYFDQMINRWCALLKEGK